jgi:hypothetical protein
MGLTRVRFTVRRLMGVIATLAVSWCMLLEVRHLIAYVGHANHERHFRKLAIEWEAKKETGYAATLRGPAEQQAYMKRESLSRGLTTLGLIGLGGALGGIGLAVRVRYRPESPDRPNWVESLAAVCSVGAKIVVASLIIAAVLYIGILLLVVVGDD